MGRHAESDDNTAASVTLASSIDYMPVSKLVKSLDYGNGLNDWNTFSQDYEADVLAVYNGPANVCNVAHSRTDKLNVTNLWDNVTTSNNQSLWYHPTNRLQNADGPWGSRTYYYDGVGNRAHEISTPPGSTTSTTRTYSYPATNNKLSSVVIGASTTERSFTYDVVSKTRLRHDAGNISHDSRSGTAYVYAYNKRNRLNTVTVAASLKGTYTYYVACPPSAGRPRAACDEGHHQPDARSMRSMASKGGRRTSSTISSVSCRRHASSMT